MSENSTEEKKTKTEFVIQKRDEDGRFVERQTYNASEPDLKVLGIMAALAGSVLGFFAWSDIRREKKRVEANRQMLLESRRKRQETAEWINSQNNGGRNVYELKDGRYLSVDQAAPKEFHILD